jgi:hypothetical protein
MTKHSYSSITAATEKSLHEYVSYALNDPENTKGYHSAFNGAFWLWFELTRGEPEQDKDGARFLDLVLRFPEELPPPAPVVSS